MYTFFPSNAMLIHHVVSWSREIMHLVASIHFPSICLSFCLIISPIWLVIFTCSKDNVRKQLASRNARSTFIVWWMGVDYELFCATLCTRSILLTIDSGIYIDDFTPSSIQTHGFRQVCTPSEKKVVLAAFLVVSHQTINKVKIVRVVTFQGSFLLGRLLTRNSIFLREKDAQSTWEARIVSESVIHIV